MLYPGLVLTINLFSSEFEFIAELSVRLRNDLAFFPWALQGLYSLAISLEFRDRVKLYGKKFDKFIQRLSFLGFLVTFVYVLTYIF
ncbi:MAG: hypothetical protein Kow0081_3110 [Candidatus Dojkabacteria bacterium]